jgi:hypothetical protein
MNSYELLILKIYYLYEKIFRINNIEKSGVENRL